MKEVGESTPTDKIFILGIILTAGTRNYLREGAGGPKGASVNLFAGLAAGLSGDGHAAQNRDSL